VTRKSPWIPAPNGFLLAGTIVAGLGYVLPWFQRQDGYSWWFSGWEFATLSTGGGWTLLVFPALVVALLASLWAGRSVDLARTALTALVAAAFLAVVVVAACFVMVPEPDGINPIADLPFGIGIPLMAVGFGLGVAGAIRDPRERDASADRDADQGPDA
jgi:hypothetical protein